MVPSDMSAVELFGQLVIPANYSGAFVRDKYAPFLQFDPACYVVCHPVGSGVAVNGAVCDFFLIDVKEGRRDLAKLKNRLTQRGFEFAVVDFPDEEPLRFWVRRSTVEADVTGSLAALGIPYEVCAAAV